MFKQQINNKLMAILCSKMKSHVAILCLCFNVCSCLEQQSCQLKIAVHAGDVQRRETTLMTRTEKDEVKNYDMIGGFTFQSVDEILKCDHSNESY